MARIFSRSVCALDCPDACSVLVHIDGDRATRLQGDPDHPFTRGFLCAKVTRYLDRVYDPARLMHPLRRVGRKGEGRFERISWEAAMDEIADRLQQVSNVFGPEAILPYSYAGTMGIVQGNSLDRRFFHALGASRLDRTICSSAGGAALTEVYGAKYGTEAEQFLDSKLIIVWCASTHATNVHLWPFIVEARRRGAKLITIDPVMTRTAQLADQHLAIQPGSDLALALGLMHVILAEGLQDSEFIESHASGFEGLAALARDYPPPRVAAWTGLSESEIVNLAREYATAKPAVIRLNYGIQRSERGAAAVRAVAMLPVITGSWRHAGGGLQMTTSGAFQFNRPALEMPELQRRSALGRAARLVNMSNIAEVLTSYTDPPVKAMVVYNSNPAAVAPHQNLLYEGLSREDLFTVVLEQFQTDTADFADIVLPVTTFLEHADLYMGYGHHFVQHAPAVLPAPGECKRNTEIWRMLAARMGLTDPALFVSDEQLIDDALSSGHPFLEGITRERLEREGSIRLNVSPPDQPFLPFANGFATADGRCRIEASTLRYTPPAESRHGDPGLVGKYPLEFLSPKNAASMNSTFGNRTDTDAETAVLYMNTEDAAPRSIGNGDLVRVSNARGALLLRADVNGKVRQGVVSSPSTRWPKLARDRRNANALTSCRLTDAGGGATFFSCLVEVEKCGD